MGKNCTLVRHEGSDSQLLWPRTITTKPGVEREVGFRSLCGFALADSSRQLSAEEKLLHSSLLEHNTAEKIVFVLIALKVK